MYTTTISAKRPALKHRTLMEDWGPQVTIHCTMRSISAQHAVGGHFA